ncbi:MAG: hypothetical protein VXY17_01640 [Verrucomicrobiota bacterium]|nr:hypothetical protein [Verrucomicrobiota bacterium]
MEKTDSLIPVQIPDYALDGQIREAVYCYLDTLGVTGADREIGAMSTVVWGEAVAFWSALQSAIETVAAKYKIIVNTVICNTAPLYARACGRR